MISFKQYLLEQKEEQILTEVFDKPYEMMNMTDTFAPMIKHQYGDSVSNVKVHAVPDLEGMMVAFHRNGAMEIHHSPIDPSGMGQMIGNTPNPRMISTAMKMGKEHIDNGGKVRIVTSQHTLPAFTSLGDKIAKRYNWKIDHKPIEDQNFYGAQHFPGIHLSAMEISKNDHLNEEYKEGKDSTVTHDGKEYSVDSLIHLTKDVKPEIVQVNDLKWILDGYKDTKSDKLRTRKVDLLFPILVTKWKGKIVVIDGFHRLLKAISLGNTTMKAKFVTPDMLEQSKVK